MGRMIFVGLEDILKDKIDEKAEKKPNRSHGEIVMESIIEMEETINALQSKAKNEAEREFALEWKKEIFRIKDEKIKD